MYTHLGEIQEQHFQTICPLCKGPCFANCAFAIVEKVEGENEGRGYCVSNEYHCAISVIAQALVDPRTFSNDTNIANGVVPEPEIREVLRPS